MSLNFPAVPSVCLSAAVSVYVIQIKASNNFSFSLAFDAVHFPTFEGDAQSAMLLSVLVWFEALVELRGCGVGFDQMRPAVRGNSSPSTAILVVFFWVKSRTVMKGPPSSPFHKEGGGGGGELGWCFS